ncbi:MAG: hypothetical protein Q4G14_07505 [Paracoccus sp. (in: a-proteobacteria)]|nr:hypothetical protein [Paracoccus sp. (in: a-proteobacteria)]
MITNLIRLPGRTPRGTRLKMDTAFGRWGTQTLIAGLPHDALIAPWCIKGAKAGPAFAACIRKVLISEINSGTVAILGNPALIGTGRRPRPWCPWLLVSRPPPTEPRQSPYDPAWRFPKLCPCP